MIRSTLAIGTCLFAVLSSGGATRMAAAQTLSTASGQAYPTAPVRIVVPYPPGGGTDILGRPICQKLSERFGQQFVVDNRSGAKLTHIPYRGSGTAIIDVISKLQQEVARILNLPELKERLAADGMTVVACTPEQFVEFLARETRQVQPHHPGRGHYGHAVTGPCRGSYRALRNCVTAPGPHTHAPLPASLTPA